MGQTKTSMWTDQIHLHVSRFPKTIVTVFPTSDRCRNFSHLWCSFGDFHTLLVIFCLCFFSQKLNTYNGVPQGTILGLIIFPLHQLWLQIIIYSYILYQQLYWWHSILYLCLDSFFLLLYLSVKFLFLTALNTRFSGFYDKNLIYVK